MTIRVIHLPPCLASTLLLLLSGCGQGDSPIGQDAAPTESRQRALAVASPSFNPAGSSGTYPPVVFNATGSARAGQVVFLQGDNFGNSPFVYLDDSPAAPLPIVNRSGTNWIAVRLPDSATGALQLRIRNDSGTSALVKLNAARPLHLDALELVPGGPVRVYGRNLVWAGRPPKLTINGVDAPIDLANSNEHQVTATVPKTLVASRAATITVDNGNGTGAATLDRQVVVLRQPGADPFGLGLSWAAAFAPIAAHVVDAAADSRLPDRVVCDGVHDDTVGLQRAVDLAAADGGGIVQLPAGHCRLNDWLVMRSRVVLQGAGKTATELAYSVNYPIYAIGLDLTGIRNLTFANTGSATEGPLLKESTHVVMQNVAIRLGTSRQLYLSGNRHFAVSGSDFVQTGSLNQQGPYTFDDSTGLAFEGNTTRWVNGAPTFGRVHDSVIAANRFTRDATVQTDAGAVHSMTLDFAHRVAVIGNSFDVAGGPVTNKTRNDGETILIEGGSSARTENLGAVFSATATTLTDRANTLAVDPFGTGTIPENYGIAIVAGKGAGQTRRVTAYTAPTLTVDRAWDVVPDASSKYASFVWGLEKSLLKNNALAGNPRGIWLYGTSVREVDVVGNRIAEGGGIYLRSTQNLATKRFTVVYDVRIAGNEVVNSTGNWMSYVNSVFVNMDARAFGIATLGVEIRDNAVVANSPNATSGLEEYANTEGYMAMMRVESWDPYETSATPRLLGTLLTGNRCTHCDIAIRLGTGAGGTTIDATRLIDSTTLLDDGPTTSTAERSTDTWVGL